MKKTIAITLAIVILLAANTTAEQITLKNTFFGGYKYSTDGQNFKGVGMSGKSLRELMTGNDAALSEMDAYKKRKTWSAVWGWPGSFMVGWACGSAIADNWKDSDEYMLGIGLGMVVISGLIEGSANKHLKQAVSIYNGEDQALLFDLNYKKSTLSGNGQVTLALSYNF